MKTAEALNSVKSISCQYRNRLLAVEIRSK